MENRPGRIPLDVAGAKHGPANGGGVTSLPPSSPTSNLPEVAGPVDVGDTQEKIFAVLKTCFDPEIPVNIYELGLIYGVDVTETGETNVRMTLTSPACPVAGSLPGEVQAKVAGVPGVKTVK